MVVAQRRGKEPQRPAVLVLKWALMVACIFWVLMYRIGSAADGIPEFVYVNF